MTKEEALEQWIDSLEEWQIDSMLRADAFMMGWDAAIKSLEKPKDKVPYSAILYTLNSITGKNFKPIQANCRHIHARWNEGMREPDFELVARIKNAQWKDDPMMALYIRPETLYGTKMDSYLNEPPPKKTKLIRNHLGQMVEVEDQ